MGKFLCCHTASSFIQPDDQKCLISEGKLAFWVWGGGRGGREGGRLGRSGRAGGKLVLARDALLCSIADVGSVCELTTATTGTAPSRPLTGKHFRAIRVIGPSRSPLRGVSLIA